MTLSRCIVFMADGDCYILSCAAAETHLIKGNLIRFQITIHFECYRHIVAFYMRMSIN